MWQEDERKETGGEWYCEGAPTVHGGTMGAIKNYFLPFFVGLLAGFLTGFFAPFMLNSLVLVWFKWHNGATSFVD